MSRFSRVVLILLLGVMIALSALLVSALRAPTYQGRSVAQWLADLDEGQPSKTQSAAQDGIRQMGDKAVPEIIRYLHKRDTELTHWLDWAFGRPFHYTPQKDYQARALSALKLIGPPAREALPSLQACLEGGEQPREVISAMASIDPASVVPLCLRVLSHTNLNMRLAATLQLAEAVTHAESAIPRLLVGLKDPDSNVRGATVWALACIHKRPDVVVPALVATLADTNLALGQKVLGALRQLGSDARQAVPAIERQLSDTGWGIRALAVAALRVVDADAAARAGYSLPKVLGMLQAPDADTRKTAAYSLLMSRDEAGSVVPALIPTLTDSDPLVRKLVLWTLERYKDKAQSALPALAQCLESHDESFRASVTNVIIQIAPNSFVRTKH